MIDNNNQDHNHNQNIMNIPDETSIINEEANRIQNITTRNINPQLMSNLSNNLSSNHNQRNLNRTASSTSNSINKETIRYLMNTKICFLISLIINIILLVSIFIMINWSDADKTLSFSLENLEEDGMYLIYILLFFFCFISIWNFFLLISLIIFRIDFTEIKIDHLKNFNSSTLTIDIFYFNPGIYCFIIYTFYKSFFPSNLDLLIWHLISAVYFVNFVFSNKLLFYTKLKVKYITNKIFYDNNKLRHSLSLNRIRANQIVLILVNIFYVYFLGQCLRETDFIHKYLLIGKGVYLFSKQIENFLLNEMKFMKLSDSHPNRKEDKFLRNLTIKHRIRMINLVFIIHKLMLANYLLITSLSAVYFYIFPLSLVYINLTVGILNEIRSYERVKRFYTDIDKFPAIEYEKDSNEECIICTESFLKARKLPCGHQFHFFCIAKWLKKNPSKICPICRRDIFTDSNNRNNLGPRSFGFRIQSRLFSWLPNISFRILRGPSISSLRNNNTNNTVNRNGLQNIQGELQQNRQNNLQEAFARNLAETIRQEIINPNHNRFNTDNTIHNTHNDNHPPNNN